MRECSREKLRTLQRNMVFTNEPLCVFPDENLGVRVEDTILITEHNILIRCLSPIRGGYSTTLTSSFCCVIISRRNFKGKPMAFITITRDITERVRREEAV
jgi:Xaa-Pro aminopeptidase